MPEESSPEGDNGKSIVSEDTPSTSTKQRPDTLILECPLTCTTDSAAAAAPSKYLNEVTQKARRSFKKPQPRRPVQKNASVAEIYFISSAEEPNNDYDSIEVIDERRNKSFAHMGHSGESGNLERTDTVIYRDCGKSTATTTVLEEQQSVATERDNGPTTDTNAMATTMTIMAEIEQRRSSNVSDSDTLDVR